MIKQNRGGKRKKKKEKKKKENRKSPKLESTLRCHLVISNGKKEVKTESNGLFGLFLVFIT